MFTCIHIYIYIYIFIYIYIYIYIYTHIYIYIYMYIYIYIFMYIHIYLRVIICKHTFIGLNSEHIELTSLLAIAPRQMLVTKTFLHVEVGDSKCRTP